MTRPLLRALALLVAAFISSGIAAAPASAEPITRHAGPNWVWFGPKSWDASYGVYGITATSANGRSVLDLGFSSIQCAAGADWNQSVANYFAAQRQALQGNGATITAASAIVHPSGMSQLYRRQVVSFATGGKNGAKGKAIYDYDYSTTVDGFNYCYQRSIAMYAPKSRWKADKKTLKNVWDSLAYSGPGAYEDDE